MTKFEIIQDGDKLSASIGSVLKLYTQTFEKLHIAVVSAIWHACKTGDAVYMNRIYPNLNSNDQQALRSYVRRIHAINGLDGEAPDGLNADLVNAAVLEGSVFGFAKGQFSIVHGHTSEQAQSMLKLVEERFINPDGKTDKMVFERNNFAEVKLLGDVDLIEALIKKTKEADADTETRKSTVSASTKEFLAGIRDMLTIRKNQLTLSDG